MPPFVPPVPVLLVPPKSSQAVDPSAKVSPSAQRLLALQYGAVATQSPSDVHVPPSATRSVQVPAEQRRFSRQGGLVASQVMPLASLATHEYVAPAIMQDDPVLQTSPGLPHRSPLFLVTLGAHSPLSQMLLLSMQS